MLFCKVSLAKHKRRVFVQEHIKDQKNQLVAKV